MKRRILSIFLIGGLLLSVLVYPEQMGVRAAASDIGSYFDYISDLAGEITAGWGAPGYDKGLDGNPIVIRDPVNNGAGVTYAKGLTLHAASKAIYDITDCGYSKFTAIIGICDSSNISDKTKSSSEFIVEIDGVQKYKSGVIRIGDGNSSVSVDIPANAKTLTLITTDGGNGNSGDHSVWADAKLLIADGKLTDLRSVSAMVSTGVLDAGKTASVTVSGILNDGTGVTFEPGSLSFTSSDPSVATVSSAGIIRGVAGGMVSIACTAIRNGITKSDSVELIVVQETGGPVWAVDSPDGSVRMAFAANQAGEVYYTVLRNGETILGLAPTGMQTSLGDFRTGLAFQSVTAPTEINETYSVASRKKDVYVNHAFERILSFSKGDMIFSIIARAYDDGAAFRYRIESRVGGAQTMTITEETTAFQIPAESKAWAMPYESGSVWTYQGLFSEQPIRALSGNQSVPLLYETPAGTFSLLTEAHLTGEYPGSMAKAENGGLLRLSFPPQQGTTAVSTSAPFESPWRVAIIGTLADIVENTLVENLSPDPDLSIDYSFVEPGACSWTWIFGGNAMQSDPVAIKKYIDLAAEMGWKYFLLDEGWQPAAPAGSDSKYAGYYDWFGDMAAYADSKGVGLLVWVSSDDLSTAEKRMTRLADWKAHGVKGIKADFFNRETQDRTRLYEDIYKACAELGLIVNIHGSNKPSGEVRTYPNVLTREAIRGQEYSQLIPYQYTILPFTRTAVGPADVTETVYPMDGSSTIGFQSAMTVLVQNGLHCFASSAEDIRGSKVYSLYKNLPVVWDDTKLIDGYPGKFATMVRRSGEDWYGASVTVDVRNAVFPLDFLGDGEYYAVIYKDGTGDRNDLALNVQKVTKNTTLTIPMKANGGCAVKILKNKPAGVIGVTLDTSSLTLEPGSTRTITAALTPANPDIGQLIWTSGNSAVATVDSNGVVTGISRGTAVITAASLVDDSVKAQCTVTVIDKQYKINNSVNWRVIRKVPEDIRFNSANSISITARTSKEGELDGAEKAIKNMVVFTPPDDNFTITVKVNGGIYASYQTAGLAAFTDEKNLIVTMRRYHGSFGGNCFEALRYESGYNEITMPDSQKDIPAYLKLEKNGASFISSYSYDGTNWTQIASVQSGTVGATDKKDIKIGVYAGIGSGTAPMVMTFEDFTYTSPTVPGAVIPFCTLIGDVSGDNAVTATDVVALRGLIADNTATPAQLSAGDIDEDGALTDADTALLLGRLNILPGDVSGDGKIAPLDVMVIRKLLLDESVTDDALAAGDLDENGVLNLVDIMKLRKILIGQ